MDMRHSLLIELAGHYALQAKARGKDAQENHGEHVVQIVTIREHARECGMLVHCEQIPDNEVYDLPHDRGAFCFSVHADRDDMRQWLQTTIEKAAAFI